MAKMKIFVFIFGMLSCAVIAEQSGSLVADWLVRQSAQFERSQMEKNGELLALGCEEEKITIKCSNRFTKMEIVKTFYGRDDAVTCPNPVLDTTTKCEEQANDVAKKVMDLCNGENKCKIPVNVDFLGHDGHEICPGIRKYLRILYKCTQHPKIREECSGNCSQKCWPLCQETCCHPPPPPTTKPTPSPTPPPTTPPQTALQTAGQNQEKYPACPMPCNANCAPLCLLSCCNPIPQQSAATAGIASPQMQIPKGFACPAPCSAKCFPSCTMDCCRDSLSQPSFPQDAQVQRYINANQGSFPQRNKQYGSRRSQLYHSGYNAWQNRRNGIAKDAIDTDYNAAAAAWNYRTKIWHQRMQLANQAAARRAGAFNAPARMQQRAYARNIIPHPAFRYNYASNNYYGR